MKKIIDVSFNMQPDKSNPDEVIESYKEGLDYVHFLKTFFEIIVIDHINYCGCLAKKGIRYYFFKGKNKFSFIPFKTLLFIKKENPEMIIVQGLSFPLQVIFLRLLAGRTSKIIAQHHGERPFGGIRKMFQKIADGCINAYLFTAKGNANAWIDSKIIKNPDKIFEVLEASTYLAPLNKHKCRNCLDMSGVGSNCLWVGRLAKEKDPITIIKGFEKYLDINPKAMLYMIYQEATLLPDIKKITAGNKKLCDKVIFIGSVSHDDLAVWYSAADFFVSGSHREGSGYALIEALHCGCIPIVTNIPSFKKITNGFGALFNPGDADGLLDAFCKTQNANIEETSKNIIVYSKHFLSFKSIADNIYSVCKKIS